MFNPAEESILQEYIFRAELFVLHTATWSVSAAPKLPQVRELLVWFPQKSGTTYLTLHVYDVATLI